MYFCNKKSELGSVLIAVIGILGVLLIMAITFSIEMQAIVAGANEAPKKSDVKNAAKSGRNYLIAQILATGSGSQLKIEQESEMTKVGEDLGRGYPSFLVDFSAMRFYDGGHNNDDLSSYIPPDEGLNNVSLRFMVEDLSGKLPVGRVKQYFQRNLLSHILYNYFNGIHVSDVPGPVVTSVRGEPYNSGDSEKSKIDNDRRFLRSLTPIERIGGGMSPKISGIPYYDGLLRPEELGSAQTHYSSNKLKTAEADDKLRSKNTTRLLMEALTTHSRFVPSHGIEYVSINPRVMSIQNPGLFSALFDFDEKDDYLKLQYSVGFDPEDGLVLDELNDNKPFAVAKGNFFSSKIGGGRIITTDVGTASSASYTCFAYNARDWNGENATVKYNNKDIKVHNKRYWPDHVIADVSKLNGDDDKVYYLAMKKAVNNLKKHFDGANLSFSELVPVISRQALEYVIIKAVFGESILLLDDCYDVDVDGKFNGLDLKKIYLALENDKVDLSKVKFVSNLISDAKDLTAGVKFSGLSDADKYFVPDWDGSDDGNGKVYDKVYTNGIGGGYSAKSIDPDKSIKRPRLGYEAGENLLAHPATNQKGLHQFYPTIALWVSSQKQSSVSGVPGGVKSTSGLPDHDEYNLYTGEKNVHFKSFESNTNGKTLVWNFVDNKAEEEAGQPHAVSLYNLGGESSPGHHSPADYTPFETKIRMAVLINLLNSIIPAKFGKTNNTKFGNADSLFSTSKEPTNENLKNFIYFDSATCEYKINHADNPNPYMDGWEGGVKSPGMTLWKYGQHSTTFNLTIDAAKEQESVRLSEVITFDFHTDIDYDKTKDVINLDSKLASFTGSSVDHISYIYLTPPNRKGDADSYVVGTGKYRVPTVDLNGWRTLSVMWGDVTLMDTIGMEGERWVNIICFPSQSAGRGPMGGASPQSYGRWYYVNHPSNAYSFVEFTRLGSSKTVSRVGPTTSYGPSTGAPEMRDITLGTPRYRQCACGTGSWLMWTRINNKEMPAGTLQMELYYQEGNTSASTVVKVSFVHKDRMNAPFYSQTHNLLNITSNGPDTKIFPIGVTFPKGEIFIFLEYLDATGNNAYMHQIRVVEK